MKKERITIDELVLLSFLKFDKIDEVDVSILKNMICDKFELIVDDCCGELVFEKDHKRYTITRSPKYSVPSRTTAFTEKASLVYDDEVIEKKKTVDEKILEITKKILADIIAYEGEVFGNTRKECGNYLDLDLEKAKEECRRYLKALEAEQTFEYKA